MLTRVVTAMVGIPTIVLLSVRGGWIFSLSVLILSQIGLWEFYRLTRVPDLFRGWGYLISAILILTSFLFGPDCQGIVLTLAAVSLLLVVLRSFPRHDVQQAGSALLGICYVPLLLSHLVLMRNMDLGMWYVLTVFILTWAADSAAFLVGTYFGHHRLAPAVSPRKTWAGALAALLGGALAMMWLRSRVGFTLWEAAFVGIMVGLGALLGDLVESAFKRFADVKDAGKILPGHGGVLDRFDALLFAAPIFHLLIRLLLYRGP